MRCHAARNRLHRLHAALAQAWPLLQLVVHRHASQTPSCGCHGTYLLLNQLCGPPAQARNVQQTAVMAILMLGTTQGPAGSTAGAQRWAKGPTVQYKHVNSSRSAPAMLLTVAFRKSSTAPFSPASASGVVYERGLPYASAISLHVPCASCLSSHNILPAFLDHRLLFSSIRVVSPSSTGSQTASIMATQRMAIRATEENEPVLREGKPQANMQAGQGEPRRRYSAC
jgi:hypothetical protein